MCLATVYKQADESSVILQYVSKITVEGTTIILVDIMGEETRIEGTIKMVDLTNSKVVINCIE